MVINCLLCGVGGQGTVLASKLIATAAMERGEDARTAETIGMAQRGGSVVSHVRTGKEIFSPMIPLYTADLLIGFEPGEAVRCFPYLKQDGIAVVSRKAVRPVTASLGRAEYDEEKMLEYLQTHCARLILLDPDPICQACGSPKVLNTALLGAAIASGALNISFKEMELAMEKRSSPKLFALNQKALAMGATAAQTGCASYI